MRPWLEREAPVPPWEVEGYWERVGEMTPDEYVAEIEKAMWDGDRDWLYLIAWCDCCCHEHTRASCPARYWNGCRSGLAPGEEDPDHHAWARWYAEHRGMTEEEFFCWPAVRDADDRA